MKIREKFFQFLEDPDPDCKIWTGPRNAKGYGVMRWRGETYPATHIAWLLEHGEWPEQHILHTCDNPRCVFHGHLYEGSNRDNVDDMLAKGRQRRGENARSAKLSDAQVLEIRRRGSDGTHTYAQLSEEYGVSKDIIMSAMRGVTWKHLPGATKNNYQSPRVHPKREPKPPREPMRFEVRGETLTIKEIADITGLSFQTIYERAKNGDRGEELIRRKSEHTGKRGT